MHEIVSLQLGDGANLAGAHFWNTQSEVCRSWSPEQRTNILPAATLHHVTLCQNVEKRVPRVVLVGNALPYSYLGGDIEMPSVQTWSGGLDVHISEGKSLSRHDLEGTWKGVSKVEYHDRSINLASPNGLIRPSSEQILEQIRFFVEACDELQGFHVSWDQSMEWAGLCKESLMALKDLYAKQKLMTFHLRPAAVDEAIRQKAVDVLSLICTWDASDLVIPLCQPCGDEADQECPLFYAQLMDNVTLPYRCGPTIHPDQLDMDHFCQLYSTRHSSGVLQVSSVMESDLKPFLESAPSEAAFWKSCCPWISPPYDSSLRSEHVVLRGCPTGWQMDRANAALMQNLSQEGFLRLCVARAFPYPFPHNRPLLTRALSSPTVDRATLQICSDLVKHSSTVPIQRLLSQWEISLSDCVQLQEALSESISLPSSDAESS